MVLLLLCVTPYCPSVNTSQDSRQCILLFIVCPFSLFTSLFFSSTAWNPARLDDFHLFLSFPFLSSLTILQFSSHDSYLQTTHRHRLIPSAGRTQTHIIPHEHQDVFHREPASSYFSGCASISLRWRSRDAR